MENSSIFIDQPTAFSEIERGWKVWAAPFVNKTAVVGISGGVDSSCVAALGVRIFGKENVVGVTLPCDGQKDIDDSFEVIKHLGIRHVNIDIGDAVAFFKDKLDANAIEPTEQCLTNMPARIRMTALFAVAQSLGGVVINTCNRSESVCGYDTLFGDSCGCYAPVKNLVKTEVMNLASWLGLPNRLAYKTPVDGLQPLTDEEKFGFSYAELDAFIRSATAVEDGLTRPESAKKILDLYSRNRFKLEMINIKGPDFGFATDVFRAGLYS